MSIPRVSGAELIKLAEYEVFSSELVAKVLDVPLDRARSYVISLELDGLAFMASPAEYDDDGDHRTRFRRPTWPATFRWVGEDEA